MRLCSIVSALCLLIGAFLFTALYLPSNAAQAEGQSNNRLLPYWASGPGNNGGNTATASNGRAPTAILIPLYRYPTWWKPSEYIWDDVAAANRRVPIVAIINPNSGPDGGPPNQDYLHALAELRKAGVTMLGYVYTTYAERPIEAVLADIDLYANYYSLNGIFIDQATSTTDELDYYKLLYHYIRAKAEFKQVVLNPGINLAEAYTRQPVGDTVVIFEHSTGWPTYSVDDYVRNYTAQRFSMLTYGVPDAATMRHYVDLARARNIGYIYVTDDYDDNPWDTLPSYWSELVDYIAAGNE